MFLIFISSLYECHDHCKNGGKCFLNQQANAECSCPGNTTGSRCELRCEDHCRHASSCDVANGQVYCNCIAGYTGRKCETNLIPEFYKITPPYGPVAGGTNITLYGQRLNNVDKLFMTPYCGTGCTNYATIPYYTNDFFLLDASRIILKSVSSVQYGFGAYRTQPLQLQYNISFQSTALNIRRNTSMKFEYRPNPVITDISPRRTFIGGGIALTAVGQFLDSVYSPILLVYLERRLVSGNDYTVISTTNFVSRSIDVYNGTAMLCRTPTIDLTATSQSQPRVKRQSPTDDEEINSEEIEFYIGFQLDALEEYKNLSEKVPEAGRLVVYANPTFEEFDGTRSYNPKSEKSIDLKGKSLTLGASLEDYKVEIGQDTCDVIDLHDNLIVCEPPKDEPKIIKEGPYKNGEPRVYVNAGYYRFAIGHIDYVKDWTLYIIIGSAIAGFLLLLIIGLTIFCCIRKGRKTNTELKNNEATNAQQQQFPAVRGIDVENDAVRRFRR